MFGWLISIFFVYLVIFSKGLSDNFEQLQLWSTFPTNKVCSFPFYGTRHSSQAPDTRHPTKFLPQGKIFLPKLPIFPPSSNKNMPISSLFFLTNTSTNLHSIFKMAKSAEKFSISNTKLHEKSCKWCEAPKNAHCFSWNYTKKVEIENWKGKQGGNLSKIGKISMNYRKVDSLTLFFSNWISSLLFFGWLWGAGGCFRGGHFWPKYLHLFHYALGVGLREFDWSNF